MPKTETKRKEVENDSEEEEPKTTKKTVEDEDESDDGASKKKVTPKKSAKKNEDEDKPAKKSKTEKKKGEDAIFELGDPLTRLTVRQFKGKIYVDLRKFYEDKGSKELKPGKQGISLTVDQWKEVKELVEKVDEAIADF